MGKPKIKNMELKTNSGLYILDKKGEAVKTTDLMEWAKWIRDNREKMKIQFSAINNYAISTVFLGIDYSYGLTEKPMVFETMVFIMDLDTEDGFREIDSEKEFKNMPTFERTGDKEDAAKAHKLMVARVESLVLTKN
jgi:hypothetical protein